MRAAADSTKSLDGRLITVTGFTKGTDLARVVIVCCAADAQLASIHLSGDVGHSLGPHLHFEVINQKFETIPVRFFNVSKHQGVPRTSFFYSADGQL